MLIFIQINMPFYTKKSASGFSSTEGVVGLELQYTCLYLALLIAAKNATRNLVLVPEREWWAWSYSMSLHCAVDCG